jgi:membrane-bound metal-dependent hydrolase YbcI (DUF457 family)
MKEGENMLFKTHLALGILAIILIIPHVTYKFIFGLMVLVATILPDIDTGFSNPGKYMIFKPLQFFVKHRGIIHSFTFAIIISIALSMFFPIASLGFFVGFSVHLLADAFTKDGIQAFWPFKKRSTGIIRTGGRVEDGLFISIILIDILAIILSLIS